MLNVELIQVLKNWARKLWKEPMLCKGHSNGACTANLSLQDHKLKDKAIPKCERRGNHHSQDVVECLKEEEL